MAVYVLPEWHERYITDMEVDILTNVIENRSRMSFAVQTVEFPGDSWMFGIEYRGMPLAEFYSVRAFWLSIRGKANRVRLWPLDHKAPRGTMRGFPTLSQAAPEGSNSVFVQTTDDGTLESGDFFSVRLGNNHNQLLMTYSTVKVGSVIQAFTVPPLRRNAGQGATVTWNRPTVDCVIVEKPTFHTHGNMSEGFTVMLVEAPVR